jgi:hypothetical protein
MTAVDGGALPLPHRRGRRFIGRFEIFSVNLQCPYNYGLISISNSVDEIKAGNLGREYET